MNKNPLSRRNNIVVQELDNEILIYDLTKHKAYSLNHSSALVWQLCDGNKSVAEIAGEMGRRLNSPIDEDFVWLALDQLKKEKLVSNCENTDENFKGMSRRKVISKVGTATLVALPFVTSLVAPLAVSAQSAALCDSTSTACTAANGRPNDCCCQNGPQCASGNCVGIGGGLKACRT